MAKRIMKIIVFLLFVLAPVFIAQASDDHAEQEQVVLLKAKTYWENTFSGVPADFNIWYSDEYHSSGWILMIDSPEGLAKRNQEYAMNRGGISSIDLEIKDQIEGLVSLVTLVTFNNGETKEHKSCWIYQNDLWKMHTSCLQILVESRDLNDNELETIESFENILK